MNIQLPRHSKIILALLCLCALEIQKSQSLAAPPVVTPTVIFDASESVVDVIDIQVKCCCAVDTSGQYEIILVRPLEGGGSLVSVSTPQKTKDTIVVFAWIEKESLVPIFPWNSFRTFSRPLKTNNSPNWDGFEVSDVERSSRLSYPTKRNAKIAWAYKLPASDALSSGIELLIDKRPEWQRMYTKQITFPGNGSSNHEFIFSRRPTQRSPKVKITGSDMGFSYSVSTHNDVADFFFIPKSPISPGDSVSVQDVTISSSKTFGCWKSNPSQLFPRIDIRSRTDLNTEPVLMINAGGAITFPSGYKSIEGFVRFPDGERITFSGNTTNGALVEWPAHCPLESVFEVWGTVKGSSSSSKLKHSTYFLKKEDSAYVAKTSLRAHRIDFKCKDPGIDDIGGTIRIPNWKHFRGSIHCVCHFQVVK